jgi:hypothetical protein
MSFIDASLDSASVNVVATKESNSRIRSRERAENQTLISHRSPAESESNNIARNGRLEGLRERGDKRPLLLSPAVSRVRQQGFRHIPWRKPSILAGKISEQGFTSLRFRKTSELAGSSPLKKCETMPTANKLVKIKLSKLPQPTGGAERADWLSVSAGSGDTSMPEFRIDLTEEHYMPAVDLEMDDRTSMKDIQPNRVDTNQDLEEILQQNEHFMKFHSLRVQGTMRIQTANPPYLEQRLNLDI